MDRAKVREDEEAAQVAAANAYMGEEIPLVIFWH